MVNELKELLRANVSAPPPDDLDLVALVAGGRRRVRTRRAAAVGVGALATAAVVVTASIGWPGADRTATADHPPKPDAPTLHLDDARPGVEGRDFEILASHTNHNLNRANGQYFDGMTEDGLILFRDGARDANHWRQRFALLDPASGQRDWLPDPGIGQNQTWPVELGAHRLVLVGADKRGIRLRALVFDRDTRQWHRLRWPDLPDVGFPQAAVGPDDRLFVSVPATQGEPPEGGWPTGSDGEADDAGAEGDTYHLWSVSLSDASDVRDEGLTVGDLVFTDTSMVWTDSTNGAAGLVHVRDLASGEERSFDPHAGARCNLLSFDATDDRVIMGEYCGTYAGGVRDDRLQVLSTDGDQVVTIQGNGIEPGFSDPGAPGAVAAVTSYARDSAGTYVYDLGTGRFTRISDGASSYGTGGGPAPADRFFWSTPVNHRKGAAQHVGRLLPQK